MGIKQLLRDLKKFLGKPIVEPSEPAEPAEPTPGTATATVQVGSETGTVTIGGDAGGGKDQAADSGNGGGVSGFVLKVLTAVAAGIGITGAVAVVGASIFWIRFDEQGLPATQAVNALPKSELVVLGAQETIIFVLIALAAVALIALWDPKGVVKRSTVLALGILALAGVIYVIWGTNLTFWWVALMVALGAILVVACVRFSLAFPGFWPLIVSVFLAALVFSATVAFLIVKDQDFVQAIAILRDRDDKGLTGVYVTATDKTIYFGHLGPEPNETALYEVSRSKNVTYAVGPLEKRPEATDRAVIMLVRLKDQEKRLPKPPKPAKSDEAAKQK